MEVECRADGEEDRRVEDGALSRGPQVLLGCTQADPDVVGTGGVDHRYLSRILLGVSGRNGGEYVPTTSRPEYEADRLAASRSATPGAPP